MNLVEVLALEFLTTGVQCVPGAALGYNLLRYRSFQQTAIWVDTVIVRHLQFNCLERLGETSFVAVCTQTDTSYFCTSTCAIFQLQFGDHDDLAQRVLNCVVNNPYAFAVLDILVFVYLASYSHSYVQFFDVLYECTKHRFDLLGTLTLVTLLIARVVVIQFCVSHQHVEGVDCDEHFWCVEISAEFFAVVLDERRNNCSYLTDCTNTTVVVTVFFTDIHTDFGHVVVVEGVF
ncbi:hypothetical protein D3C87_1077020 [compost metagenome]